MVESEGKKLSPQLLINPEKIGNWPEEHHWLPALAQHLPVVETRAENWTSSVRKPDKYRVLPGNTILVFFRDPETAFRWEMVIQVVGYTAWEEKTEGEKTVFIGRETTFGVGAKLLEFSPDGNESSVLTEQEKPAVWNEKWGPSHYVRLDQVTPTQLQQTADWLRVQESRP